MIFAFWFLVTFLVLWYFGAMGFVYHVLVFRYPKDITLVMLMIFLTITVPMSLAAVSYLANFYGGI